jgi:hypothetical protein
VGETLGRWLFIDLEQTKGLSDGGDDESRVPNSHERDEPDAVRIFVSYVGRNPEREPRLSDAPWAGQGHQADIVPQQELADSSRLPLASDKRRERIWKRDKVVVRLTGIHDASAPHERRLDCRSAHCRDRERDP